MSQGEGIEKVRAAYLETLPWIVHLYLHTLKLSVDGVPRADLLRDLSYTAPIPHGRAAALEAVLELPPNSTVSLRLGIGRAFLQYGEHPPDAQRGWELPAAVVVVLPEHPGNDSQRRVYTSALLVDPATPDFSMPYNVIIFSCSLVAFIFGSVFNGLTRRFIVVAAREPGLQAE